MDKPANDEAEKVAVEIAKGVVMVGELRGGYLVLNDIPLEALDGTPWRVKPRKRRR